jgi:CHASE3 domain sensor protein
MDVQEYRTAKARLNNISNEISDKEANELINLALKVKKHEELMFPAVKINWFTIALCIVVVILVFIIILILS